MVALLVLKMVIMCITEAHKRGYDQKAINAAKAAAKKRKSPKAARAAFNKTLREHGSRKRSKTKRRSKR